MFDKEQPGAPAVAVIGKPDATTRCLGYLSDCQTASSTNIADASGCAVGSDGKLYLSDFRNHRVLVYDQIPTSDGVAADYVIGQADFDERAEKSGSDGAGWTRFPRGIFATADKLYVANTGHHRVLIYDLPIAQNQQLASGVVGQNDYTTVSNANGSDRYTSPSAVILEGSRMFVLDGGHSRVMVYNAIPNSNVPADFAIGSPDFDSTAGGLAANRFSGALLPSRLAMIDDHLWVPDRDQGRMLGFDTTSVATDMDASFVLGQSDFTTMVTIPAADDGSTFETLVGPTAIANDADGGYVWVSEEFQHRIIRIRRPAFERYLGP